MYKDLASHTFNRVFQDDSLLKEWELKSVQDFVLNRGSVLPDKARKTLFIAELAERVKYEKRLADFRAMSAFDPQYIIKANLIGEVYEWLIKLEIGENKKKAPDRRWLADINLLQKLSGGLVTENFIEPADQSAFVNLFLNSDLGSTVEWKQTGILLVYLFQQLEVIGLVSDKTSNKFIEENFLHNGDFIGSVKQRRNELKAKPPRDSKKVDLIINSLKVTLPKI